MSRRWLRRSFRPGGARNGHSIVRKDISVVPEAIELIPPALRLGFQPKFEPPRVDTAMPRVVLNTLKQTNRGRLLNVAVPLAMPTFNHVEDRFELLVVPASSCSTRWRAKSPSAK